MAVTVVLVLFVAASASAQQNPKADFAVSYSALNDSKMEETFPVGWAAAFTGHVNPWLSFVGEAGGHYKTKAINDVGVDVDVKFKVHSLLGGLRFGRRGSKATVFAQILAGGAQMTVGAEGMGTSASESKTGFAVQPGVGVDVALSSRIGFRLQGDYRSFTIDGERFNEYRGAAGVVFSFGRR